LCKLPPISSRSRPADADAQGPRAPLPHWVTILDAIGVSLVAAAALVAAGGGIRQTIGGLRISVTSPPRLLLAAAVVMVLRHALKRRPTLITRLRDAAAGLISRDEHRDAVGKRSGRVRELLLVAGGMSLLTVFMTWPQAARMHAVPDLGDPVFSIWRLSWIAHQLPRDPLHLFAANIFHPEALALARSDALLLPGLVAAPFLWLGVPAALVYNVLVLASFVLAGTCMFLFVRSVSGQAPAAVVAGVAFAFYPFRFEHYNHLELLPAFWMPLALWALHRTLARGRVRDGLFTGAAIAGQYLSGMYFGIFLTTVMVPVAAVLAIGWRRVRASAAPLLAGAALTGALVAPTAVPYLQARSTAGERTLREAASYSATPRDYLTADHRRVVWGGIMRPPGGSPPERALFPGFFIVALALAAAWPRLSVVRLAWLAGLALAFDLSLGSHGIAYGVFYEWVLPFRGLRVPARASMLVGLMLAGLAGMGAARLMARARPPAARWVLAATLGALILAESYAPAALDDIPRPHPIYAALAGLPPGVLAELPPIDEENEDRRQLVMECARMFASTFHWQHLVNGYSGSFPDAYWAFSRGMKTFPDERSLAMLRALGVDRVILHQRDFPAPETYRTLIAELARRPGLREVGRASENGDEARLYALGK